MSEDFTVTDPRMTRFVLMLHQMYGQALPRSGTPTISDPSPPLPTIGWLRREFAKARRVRDSIARSQRHHVKVVRQCERAQMLGLVRLYVCRNPPRSGKTGKGSPMPRVAFRQQRERLNRAPRRRDSGELAVAQARALEAQARALART